MVPIMLLRRSRVKYAQFDLVGAMLVYLASHA